MHRLAPLTALTLLFALAPPASAERPDQDRRTADCVVTGKAEKVFVRERGRQREYVVQLRVEVVHVAGGDAKPGDAKAGEPKAGEPKAGEEPGGKAAEPKAGGTLFAYAFYNDPSPTPVTEARGHRGVPEEGQRVKMYLRENRGVLEGNYPLWFEPALEAGRRQRQQAHRKRDGGQPAAERQRKE